MPGKVWAAMKIRLDRARCAGHAQCHATAPEMFPIDDEGYCTITELEVSPAEEAKARAGADACPEIALLVTND